MLLDFFCIFSTGGLIIWLKQFVNCKLEGLVNYLIKTVLLDQKRSIDNLVVNGTVLRWKISDEKNLVFVVGYQESYNILYVDKLITMVMTQFLKYEYQNLIIKQGLILDSYSYTHKFMNILDSWESDCSKLMKGGDTSKAAIKLFKTKENKKDKARSNSKINEINTTKSSEKPNEDKDSKSNKDITNNTINETGDNNIIKNKNIPKNILMRKSKSGKNIKTEENKVNNVDSNQSKKPIKEKAKKDTYGVYNEKLADEFDLSKKSDNNTNVDNNQSKYIDEDNQPEVELNDNDFTASESEDEETNINNKNTSKGGIFSKFTSGLKNYLGNKELTEEDLKPIMKIFADGLMDKNVAKDIAEEICLSVTKSLLKTKTASFTTIKSTAKQSLKKAISKILTPKTELDILKNAISAKNRGDPYKVVFIGVNGVGKSTNLAKVAYLLKNNNLDLLIAACDNFRAGAIEQLKQHTRILGVDLFEKGYKDDIAYIAREAIDEAKRKKKDVVLIDTAGRMQDNEPLMRSLTKLIELNQPDVILFVGEALTGNDSVDQLTKFNQSLIDYSKKENPKVIDGILLTKFDTVDDKVGAALTMVYTTGKPIVYIGVGQKYTNLKKLNVNNVLNALFN